MRRRRGHKRSAQLTPLIDVLFIMLFAALIQARGRAASPEPADAVQEDAGVDAGMADAGVADAAMDAGSDAGAYGDAGAGADASSSHLVQSRRVAEMVASAVQNRDAFVVELSREGDILAVNRWSAGQVIQSDRRRERLLRVVLPSESEQELAYRGHEEPDLRLCNLVRRRFEPLSGDLDLAVVFAILDAPRDELPLALDRGLTVDLARCFNDAGFVGILIDPGDLDHAIP